MNTRVFSIPVILTFIFLVSSFPVFAQNTCEISSFDIKNRNLVACTKTSLNPEELNNTQIQVVCLGNSSDPQNGSCTTIVTPQYQNLIGLDQDCATLDPPTCGSCGPNCTYHCVTFEDISRSIGRLNVSFSYPDNTSCTTDEIISKPTDWNPGIEAPNLIIPTSSDIPNITVTLTPTRNTINNFSSIIISAIIGIITLTIFIVLANILGIKIFGVPKTK